MKFEKHSFLINRCIGAYNFPLYWMHIVVEVINTGIIAIALISTFFTILDYGLILFAIYILSLSGQFGLYVKKLYVHTKLIITGESLYEN